MMHAHLRNALGHMELDERLRRAESQRILRSARVLRSARRARPAARRWLARIVGRAGATGRAQRPRPEADVRIRFATQRDRETWPELAREAPERVLVADFNGTPHAALSLVDGAVLAVAEERRANRPTPADERPLP
jgi:hypothetical protein